MAPSGVRPRHTQLPMTTTPSAGNTSQDPLILFRQRYTEAFFESLSDKAGGTDALLAMTRGKSLSEAEFIVGRLMATERETALHSLAERFLLDTDQLFYEGLEARRGLGDD